MSVHEKYHLHKVINASGKMTILGVSKYNEMGITAQQIGNKEFFVMEELHKNVGKYVANLLETEDVYITSSASAAIAQAVAGIIGQGSIYHLHNPYTSRITKREIIIPKGHNVDFGAPIETMITLGGGKIVEAGYSNKCNRELVVSEITENTAALFYVKSHHAVQKNMVSLEEMVSISNEYGIPLIVDAAAEQDLKKYYKMGATLVAYSGAKAIEGPTSGMLVGKKEFVAYARLQMEGIGRAMKVGKENILGLAAAIEDYLSNGPEDGEQMKKRLYPFLEQLNTVRGIKASMVQDSSGREIYRAKVEVDVPQISAKEIIKQMKESNPAIYVREYQANMGIIEFDIRAVDSKEMSLIVEQIRKITGDMK